MITSRVSSLRPSTTHFVAVCQKVSHWAVIATLALVQPALAIVIDFNGGTQIITDNGIGDLNPITGILDFNTIVGGYSLQGSIDNVAGPNLVSLLGSPTAQLRLTNFTAEAIGTPPPMFIQFFDNATGVFTAVTGADSLDPYVGHATGLPVFPGSDRITDWLGFMSGVTFGAPSPGPPPYNNPFLPPSSPPLQYPVTVTHSIPIPGVYTNPVFGAYLSFQLGANGNQLILNSSGEVGFVGTAVPEASTLVLSSVVAFIVLAASLRRRFIMRSNDSC